MKKKRDSNRQQPRPGSRILASLREAVDWAEGNDLSARVSTIHIPVIDVRALRRRLGMSQSAFAARFGFPPATLRNWEQGRTRPDAPARVLLAVIARHPEAVDDALQHAN